MSVGPVARLGEEDEAPLGVGADGRVLVPVRAVEADAHTRDRSGLVPRSRTIPLSRTPLTALTSTRIVLPASTFGSDGD